MSRRPKTIACPHCGHCTSDVINSRGTGRYVTRRRRCNECSSRFTTIEKPIRKDQLTATEAANRLGVAPSAIPALVKTGVIRGERTGSAWQIDPNSLPANGERIINPKPPKG